MRVSGNTSWQLSDPGVITLGNVLIHAFLTSVLGFCIYSVFAFFTPFVSIKFFMLIFSIFSYSLFCSQFGNRFFLSLHSGGTEGHRGFSTLILGHSPMEYLL